MMSKIVSKLVNYAYKWVNSVTISKDNNTLKYNRRGFKGLEDLGLPIIPLYVNYGWNHG